MNIKFTERNIAYADADNVPCDILINVLHYESNRN